MSYDAAAVSLWKAIEKWVPEILVFSVVFGTLLLHRLWDVDLLASWAPRKSSHFVALPALVV